MAPDSSAPPSSSSDNAGQRAFSLLCQLLESRSLEKELVSITSNDADSAEIIAILCKQDGPLALAPKLRSKFSEITNFTDDGDKLTKVSQLPSSETRRCLNECRYFLLAAALAAAATKSGSNSFSNLAASLAAGEENFLTDMQVLPCGMIHGLIDCVRIILLPKQSESEADMHRIYDLLSAIDDLDRSQGPKDWVLDLSLVTEMPLLLFANIIAYAQRLQQNGRRLMLFSARPELFASYPSARVKTYFELRQIGGLLYSVAAS